MPLKLGKAGEALIKEFEELRLESYLDMGGVWTIGWGTTTLNGHPVTPGMKINEPVAQALFLGKVYDFLRAIEKLVKVPLNQNQIDALASFVYNLGEGNFFTSSLLLTINKKLVMSEDLWTRWNKVRIDNKLVVAAGLTRRRKREYKLFTTPTE